jgi:hypothetical protein
VLIVKPVAKNGKTIPVGTPFVSPIQLTSNASCNIAFKTGASVESSQTLGSAPGSITVEYTGSQGGCSPPSQILINAFDLTASPQSAAFSVLGGGSTVKSIKLSMIGSTKPEEKSEGVYPFYVTAKDASGKTIPFGQSLKFPIQLSSNASCVVTFGTSPAASAFTDTYTIVNTSTQVFMEFNPGAASSACPSPGIVHVTAIAQGASHATFTFTNGLPVH